MATLKKYTLNDCKTTFNSHLNHMNIVIRTSTKNSVNILMKDVLLQHVHRHEVDGRMAGSRP